jgi:replicative DNA helicase
MEEIKELISQHEATEKSWNRFKENRKREWGLYGIDMGIHPLNLLVGGWLPTKLTTIGGRSGSGKTALVTQMLQAGARVVNKRRAEFLFFTWEMESSYLIDRHVCNTVGITNRMLQQGAKLLGDKKLQEIKDAYSEAAALPVTYQEMSTDINHVKMLTKQFVDRCKEKEIAEGTKIQPVIIIDYVQMSQFEGAGLRTYGIGDFMNGAKKIANDTGAAFCIFAQISRAADSKDMPERGDFADSQSIEMASDNLILIHRPEYNGVDIINDPESGMDIPSEGKMLIRALKGRDFGIGDVLINCEVKYFRFWDQNHAFDYEYHHLYEDKNFWLDYFGF